MKAIGHFRALPLLAVFLLTGCGWPFDPCDNCSPPKEAIAELRAHGVTLTTLEFPFPDSIGTGVRTDALYTLDTPKNYLEGYNVYLIFSPSIEKAEFFQPSGNEWDEHPYAYSFSELVDDEYLLIKPYLPYNYSVAPTTDLNSQYGPIRIDNEPVELVLYGNHLLSGQAIIPPKATHLELWYRQQREDELSLVRRVALDNLYAWRQYYQSKFDADPELWMY